MSQQKCEVCKEGLSKYKCPVCLIKFCCVACFKKHKESPDCIKPELPSDQKTAEVQSQTYYDTEDTVEARKLNLLGYDKNVRKDLENRHLRQLLENLNSSQNPYEAIEQAMKEPIFLEFATHCLKIVDEKR